MRTFALALFVLLATGVSFAARGEQSAAPSRAASQDLAFSAYQDGEFARAMREAKQRLAANPRDAAALTLIGRMHAEGAGVARDLKQALEWFRRAAELGDAAGAYVYSAALLANSPSPKERETARVYLEKAAAQNHPAALNLLGEMALDNNGAFADFEKAAGLFRRAAELGDADAKYALGELYKHGKGVAKDDGEAAGWFGGAAEDEHTAAMVELAILKFNGSGVERDQPGAAKLFRKAATMGNAVAQNRLAYLLAQGLGVEKNVAEAAQWRDRSNKAGLKDARLDQLLSGSGASQSPASR
jgi:TPR repeat protein